MLKSHLWPNNKGPTDTAPDQILDPLVKPEWFCLKTNETFSKSIHFLIQDHFYQLQGKVMFSEVSVSHSVHSGGLDRPPEADLLSWMQTLLEADLPGGRHP